MRGDHFTRWQFGAVWSFLTAILLNDIGKIHLSVVLVVVMAVCYVISFCGGKD